MASAGSKWLNPWFAFITVLSVILLLLFLVRDTKSKPSSRKYAFGITSITERGESVRSKAEKQIADFLHKNNIDYIYEKTIIVGKFKHKIKYDFYIPDKNVYVEYWGMENSKSEIREAYVKRKNEKIRIYQKYNLNLVSLYPNDLPKLELVFPVKLKTAIESNSSIFQQIRLWCSLKIHGDYKFYNYNHFQNEIKEFCVHCGIRIPLYISNCNRCGSRRDILELGS